jgi:RecA/RadA recombinase
MDFLQQVIKDSKNEYAALVSDGIAAGDVESFVDTGSYIFNALVSGSLFGGIPSNKITAIAGESGTGKTFFCLSVVRNFLNSDPDAGVIYFETESAISKQMIESRGIDSKRMVIFPVDTIEEFRTQAVRIIDKYMEQPKAERKPLMFVLDSLGMLATNKEVQDASDDKNVRDMTKAQLTKSVFRILTLKLGKANIPMLVTNHTYDVVGSYVPTKEMGGGSGLKYSASTIIYLSKKKEKDGTELIGNIIKCEAKKSRLTREGSKV